MKNEALLTTLAGITFALGAALSGCAGGAPQSATAVWAQKSPLPVAMAEVGVAALDGKVYVVGGTEQRDKAPPIWASTLNMAYDPASNTWQQRAPLPQGLSHVGVAALDGKLYAIGGFTDIVHMGPRSLAYVYDPRTDSWRALAELSSPQGSIAVAAAGGKLHIFGGRKSDTVRKISPVGTRDTFAGFGTVTTHEVYDPASGRWSQAAPIPGPGRDHMGIAVLRGKVHLFGGRIADVTDNLGTHSVYDPATDSWTEAAPLPRPRSAGAYTVLNSLIVYAGGECKPGGQTFSPNAYEDVSAYDIKTDRWIALPSLPQARHAFGAATIGNVAYFAGGAPVCGGGAMTDMLSLTLM